MIQLSDIRSLTDFQRNARQHIKRLKQTGQPVVLTVNGKAEIVVQDAESYQRLLEQIDHVEAFEGIRRGLADMNAGRTQRAREALEEIRHKHDIPRDA